VTIVSTDLEKTVAALRSERGKDIWLFGGGALFRSLADLGLVDTVEVAVVPVLLGGGIPLLPPPYGPLKLRLTHRRVYEKSGIVSLEYAVSGTRAPTSSRDPGRRPGARRRTSPPVARRAAPWKT
jgi:dihydrofolate reductase